MSPPELDDPAETVLVRTTRALVGDEVRGVTYFPRAAVDQLYVRDDLESQTDVAGFTAVERLGFREQNDYANSELGEYQFTIRVFEYGYLTRGIEGGHGVFVTTDPLTRDGFEELASALRTDLRGLPSP